MPARKYSATMDPELFDEIREAAREDGMSLSAWLAAAADNWLGVTGWRKLSDEWQEEHGAFTEEELAAAEEWFNNPLKPSEIVTKAEKGKAAGESSG